MIDNLEKIFGVFRNISLSIRERKNLRLHLQAYMRENPVRVSYRTRILSLLSNTSTSIQNALNSRIFLTHPVFAACVLVLCIGLGTSYGAESSLPGQALYSFKTRVNEPIEGAFALTPQAKAEWSAELTNRRLQEAEELAATNSLTPVATADIETGLDSAVQNFNSSISLVSKQDNVQAVNVQTDLEASLNAHEVVLSSLPTSEKKNASQITSLVHKHAETISQERSDSDAVLTATDSPEVKTAALVQMKSAKKEFDQTQLLSQNVSDMQIASSVSDITQEATSDINAGDSDAKHGHWGRAFGAFQDAIRKMKETQDGVDTRNWLKSRFGIGLSATSSTTTVSTSTSNNMSTTSDNSDDSSSSNTENSNSSDSNN